VDDNGNILKGVITTEDGEVTDMFFASINSPLLQIFFPSKGWGILSPTKPSNFSLV
jgi:hypothetical protein